MKKDILDVLKVVFPILTFKYLGKAVGNIWRLLILQWRHSKKFAFETSVAESKSRSAGDFFHLQQKKEESDRAQQRTAAEIAQGKHGFFMSCVMLVVNLFMSVFCTLPSIGIMVLVCDMERIVSMLPAPEPPAEAQTVEAHADAIQGGVINSQE